MALVDEITLHIAAGSGGDGVVRWRREKGKPKGGPGGGDGGKGGDVFIVPVRDIGYLETYKHDKDFQAGAGSSGGNFGKTGKNGTDLFLKFPIGSIITNNDTDEVFELLHDDDQFLILKGGQGGFGNEHFKSSRNVAPKEATKGKPGEAADFHVELRMIADIGLIGLPNAGKSSLLNALTNAKSKVGHYQFTTLEPHLGALHDGRIIADIPGLIEGASRGKGLGYTFLRHIERTQMLWHMISVENEDMVHAYRTIRTELENYDPVLAQKPEKIVLTKSDLVDKDALQRKVKEIKEKTSIKTVQVITIHDRETLKQLLQ